MRDKIELQLADISNQMDQAALDYRTNVAGLAAQQSKLQQALLYATDIPPDIQTILDDAAK